MMIFDDFLIKFWSKYRIGVDFSKNLIKIDDFWNPIWYMIFFYKKNKKNEKKWKKLKKMNFEKFWEFWSNLKKCWEM